MRSWLCAALVFPVVGCGAGTPHVPPRDEARAQDLAVRADRAFGAARREQAFLLATHALVVRLAACDSECPEVARSFVQLGDLRCAQGQTAWAAQSYRHAMDILSKLGQEGELRQARDHLATCSRRSGKPIKNATRPP